MERIRFNARSDQPELQALIQQLAESFKQLNSMLSMQPGIRVNHDPVALSSGAAGGGILSWKNTQDSDIIIVQLVIDVLTPVVGLQGNFGHGATATTAADNILNAVALGTIRVASSSDNNDIGPAGHSARKVPKGEFLTGTGITNPAGLVGNAHILWVPVR